MMIRERESLLVKHIWKYSPELPTVDGIMEIWNLNKKHSLYFSFLLEDMASQGGILDPGRDVTEGVLLERCGLGCVPFLEVSQQFNSL